MEVFFGAQGQCAVCTGSGTDFWFEKNPERFANQRWQIYGDALLLDGYSNWFFGPALPLEMQSAFTVSILFAPQGFSHEGDGLF